MAGRSHDCKRNSFSRRCHAPEVCKPLRHNNKALLIRLRLTHDPEKWGPVFGQDHAQERGKRSAERRIQPMSAPHRQTLPPANARGAEAGLFRSPLAFRRSTAAFAKALTPWLSSGPRFLELPGANGRTLPGASAASTSRTGRSAGRDDARSLPGADWQFRPRGPLPLHPSGMPSGKASLEMSEIRKDVA